MTRSPLEREVLCSDISKTRKTTRPKFCIRHAFMAIVTRAKFHFNRLMVKSIHLALAKLQQPILKSVALQFSPFILQIYLSLHAKETILVQSRPQSKDKEKITAIYYLWMVDNERRREWE